MPVVVIAALMFALSALTAPSEAAQSCVSKIEAGPDFGSASEISSDHEYEPTRSLEPQSPIVASMVACKSEPAAMPLGVALVVIAIAMTLCTIEVLFRCTIYERPHSTDHRQR